jgi:hypothetical protein
VNVFKRANVMQHGIMYWTIAFAIKIMYWILTR